MYKKLLTILLLTLLATSIFASSANSYTNTIVLPEELTNNSRSYSASDIEAIYEANKKSAVGPFLLNTFVGFGTGSLLNKDKTGYLVGVIGDTVGCIMLLSAPFVVLSTLEFTSGSDGKLVNNAPEYINTISETLLYGGLGLVAANRIFQMIRPWIYTSNYNKNLMAELMNNVAVVPVISNEAAGLFVAASLRF